MTKNNLRQHLNWLLSRGAPDLSSIDNLTRSNPDLAVSNASAPTTQQQNISVQQRALDTIGTANITQHGQPQVKRKRDEDTPVDDPEMARLHLVPSSESKPRLLSSDRKGRSITPTTPTRRMADVSTSTKHEEQPKNTVEGLFMFWSMSNSPCHLANRRISIVLEHQQARNTAQAKRSYFVCRRQITL